MSFDWSEYLTLAKRLVGQSTGPLSQEAIFRAAISRAYYAAFNETRRHLIHQENALDIPLDGRAHEIVQDKLMQSSDASRRRVGADLGRLRRARNDADYYDELPVDTTISRKAQEAIVRAERVIQALDSLPRPG